MVPVKMNRFVPMLSVKSVTASVEFYKKLGFSVEQKKMIGIGLCFRLTSVA
jgi:hypothetical protein